MFNFLPKKPANFLILLLAISSGMLLNGCVPKAERENLSGISVGALNKATINDNSVLVWANQAATATYTYNFINYQKNLQNASQYFTADGWQAYMATLATSGNLNKVIDKKMSVSAVAGSAPIILAKGELAGRYSWRVQMPLLVTYKNNEITQIDHLTVTMLIIRTSPVENSQGLGIKQFIALKKPAATELLTNQA